MDIASLKKYQPHLIVLLLLFFMLIAFVLRILPALVTRDLPFYPVYDTDSWYTLRQIEVMVHNFPQYNWFDPMTSYPQGKIIDWGPLYPFLGAVLCLVTGAVSRSGIIATAGYVSPILAVLMVPVLYGIGKRLGDTKTGLVAAGLISVTSLVYFSYTSYGMVDHHGAEVLFSTLFFLVYLALLRPVKSCPVDWKNWNALLSSCFLPVLAGIICFLGLMVSTTVLLTLLVIAVYTLVQGLADFYAGKGSDYLCLQNLVLLSVSAVLFFLFGIHREEIAISQYSLGIVYVHLALMGETLLIRILAEMFQKKRSGFFASIAGLGLGAYLLTLVLMPFHEIAEQAQELLLGFSVYSVGVQETLPWSWANAFDTLNVGILLAAGGFLVLGYSLWQRQEREQVFFFVWSALMLLITVQHQRFLYYFTVNIVLLAALCITEPFRWNNTPAGRAVQSFFSGGAGDPAGTPGKTPDKNPLLPAKKGKKKQSGPSPVHRPPATAYLAGICIIAVCLLGVLHLALSLQQDYRFGMTAGERVIPGDWLDALGWLGNTTPDPGIDYFGEYERDQYLAPADSYGTLAVWDAGHWITFFARRLPVTNPFQDNLGGKRGTAAFFLATNESEADDILSAHRGRYIITDSAMAVDRFTNLVPWQRGSVDISSYIKWFLVVDSQDSDTLTKIHKYDDGYFQTMVVRLHNFDGAMTAPATAEYTRYTIRQPTALESAEATGYSRVITDEKTVTVSALDATTPLLPEGPELLPTSYADLYASHPAQPLGTVPALRHYRLIHESDQDAVAVLFPESDPVTLPGIKMVKIFEQVKGARIPGTGVIELPLVTNTGRTFTYRQESSAGEFIVPYSTTGNPYEVHATGPYHLAGTTRTIPVSESDVIQGRTVTQ